MAQQATSPKEGHVAHVLPPLPYPADSLEPYIDKMTMEIHHDKHHGAYVTNLNKALEGQANLQGLSIEELLSNLDRVPENIRTTVRNNGGGHMNHSMFWKIMKKGGGGEPKGKVAEAIKSAFGSFADFKTKFNQAGIDTVWIRMGLAAHQRRKANHRVHAQSGQSGDERGQTGDGPRRMGARLLSEVSKPPAGIHRGLVERRELGRDREELRISEIGQLQPSISGAFLALKWARPAGLHEQPAGRVFGGMRCAKFPCAAARYCVTCALRHGGLRQPTTSIPPASVAPAHLPKLPRVCFPRS